MRVLAPIVLAALAVAGVAQESVKFTNKTDGTAKAKYNIEILFEVGGMNATLSSKINETRTYGADKTGVKIEWDGFTLDMGGQTQDVPHSSFEGSLDKAMLPTKVTGGVEGGDPMRTFLASYYWVPTEEATKEKAITGKMPANSGEGTNEFTLTTTYMGAEKLDDKDAHKFELKVKEDKTTFEVTNTYWLNASGELLKLEGKYTALPIPALGQSANGTVKIRKE